MLDDQKLLTYNYRRRCCVTSTTTTTTTTITTTDTGGCTLNRTYTGTNSNSSCSCCDRQHCHRHRQQQSYRLLTGSVSLVIGILLLWTYFHCNYYNYNYCTTYYYHYCHPPVSTMITSNGIRTTNLLLRQQQQQQPPHTVSLSSLQHILPSMILLRFQHLWNHPRQHSSSSSSSMHFVAAFTTTIVPSTTSMTTVIGRTASVVSLFVSRQHQQQFRRGYNTNHHHYSIIKTTTFTSRQLLHHHQQRRMSTGNIDTPVDTANDDDDNKNYDLSIFDTTVRDFRTLGIQSTILLQRLQQQQLYRPTKVQIAAYPAILSSTTRATQQSSAISDDNINTDENESSSTTISSPPPQQQQQQQQQQQPHTDVTIACETGSGKTLAYLLPLIDDILQRKSIAARQQIIDHTNNNDPSSSSSSSTSILDVGYDYARAIILVPNKELVQQVVRMAAPLCGGARHSVIYGGHTLPDPTIFDTENKNDDTATTTTTPPLPQDIVRMAIMPGGLDEPLDFVPFRQTVAIGGGTQPPIDLLISTPAALGTMALSPKHIAFFADIRTIVIDEADMLLDGGYIRPLENVLMGFKRADRLDAVRMGEIPKTQHVFVAATLPNYGLRSVDAYLCRKFPHAQRIELDSLHMARHSGLIQPTVWIEMENKKDRMIRLVELFQSTTALDSLRNEKVMIFLNSVADCEASCEALQRVGIHCAPYHAQIPLSDRTVTLERFRRYDVNSDNDNIVHDDARSPIPVLVCTDLASRGLDVPGVSVVVQLQFCGNVVGHLHRMGRCGRGGNERQYGRGYVFYGIKERALVETVQAAELEQERMVLPGDVVTKDWNEDDDSNNDVTDANDRVEVKKQISTMGKVTTAFSRKRGFTKKLKKLRRHGGNDDGGNDDNEEDNE